MDFQDTKVAPPDLTFSLCETYTIAHHSVMWIALGRRKKSGLGHHTISISIPESDRVKDIQIPDSEGNTPDEVYYLREII